MALYTYIITYDGGVMPNPYHGVCTLAVCKPAIRRTAKVGDWLMATGRSAAPTKEKLIYAMRVEEIMPMEDYFDEARFQVKKPNLKGSDPRCRAGDNIYSKVGNTWKQLPGGRDKDSIEKDVSGKNVLISEHFYYFGAGAVALPSGLESLIHKNQGHRCKFPEELIQKFAKWLEKDFSPGVLGESSDPAPAAPKT